MVTQQQIVLDKTLMSKGLKLLTCQAIFVRVFRFLLVLFSIFLMVGDFPQIKEMVAHQIPALQPFFASELFGNHFIVTVTIIIEAFLIPIDPRAIFHARDIVSDYIDRLAYEDRNDVIKDARDNALKKLPAIIKIMYLIKDPDDSSHKSHQVRRERLRDVIIPGSILLSVVMIMIMLIRGCNVPQIFSAGSILMFILIMGEYMANQYIINRDKMGAKMMWTQSNDAWSSKLEDYKWKRKCIYMQSDRYKNYQRVLNAVSMALTMVGLMLTLVQELSIYKEINTLFRLPPAIDATNWVSLGLGLLSLSLLFLESVASIYWNRKIQKADSDLKYSTEINHEKAFKKYQIHANCDGLFRRKELEKARARYLLSVEAMEEKGSVSLENMYTVLDNFVTHIPRVKLFVLCATVSAFCILVWDAQEWRNIPYVLSIPIMLYPVSLWATWKFTRITEAEYILKEQESGLNGKRLLQKRDPKAIKIAVLVTSAFNAFMFFSMRYIWSGFHAMTGIQELPVLLFVILCFLLGLSAYVWKHGEGGGHVLLLNGVFTAAIVGMFITGFGHWPYVLRELLYVVGYAGVVGIAWTFVSRFQWKRCWVRPTMKCALALGSMVLFCSWYGIALGGIAEGPVVYAVGNDYQIVFTTHANSTAWVEIGENEYCDTFNGSLRSDSRVHKVSVPMQALNDAREYKICAKTMIMRGPYDAIEGRTFERRIVFRPVDELDGIQAYCISDTHDFTQKAVQTASYWGDQLDFLILAGDHASFIVDDRDLNQALLLASGVTGGTRPVVYARGNHETKGNRSTELNRYVGTADDRFYYTFRLGGIWGIVLDMGEDHEDDWWEYYDTARFAEYRKQQIDFLQGIKDRAMTEYNASDVKTRLAICHIPLTFTRETGLDVRTQRALLELLNGMRIDLMLSGHMHELSWIPAQTKEGEPLQLIDAGSAFGHALFATFPSVVVSRRSDRQSILEKENELGMGHIGVAIQAKDGEIELWYTNSTKRPIVLHNPSTDEKVQQPLRFLQLRSAA